MFRRMFSAVKIFCSDTPNIYVYIYTLYNIYIIYILHIYIYICLYEILLTLGYEKKQQQIKYYEKSLDELIFSRATKNLKMVYFTCLTG